MLYLKDGSRVELGHSLGIKIFIEIQKFSVMNSSPVLEIVVLSLPVLFLAVNAGVFMDDPPKVKFNLLVEITDGKNVDLGDLVFFSGLTIFGD